MFDKPASEVKVHWIQHQLKMSQKDFDFWSLKEAEYRDLYGSNPKDYQCKHIRDIKKYRKEAKANIDYWRNLLEQTKNKLEIHRLFS